MSRLPGIALVFAVLALVSVVIDVAYLVTNQALENQVQQRQLILNQRTQVGQVSMALAQAVAAAAVNGNDDAMRQALTEAGITLTPRDASKDATAAPKP